MISVVLLVIPTEINGLGNSLRWPRNTLYPQRLALTSPTSGGRSFGIVRLRTAATEFSFLVSLVIQSLLWRKRHGVGFCYIHITSKMWSWLPRESDLRMTALARVSSNCERTMTASVQLKKKKSRRESQGAWRQDELIGGKPPVVK
jgi:hypothetical protein